MFWLKDAHNRTLRINKAAAEFEGVNPADVEGKSAYDLYPRAQAEAFYQDDLEVVRIEQAASWALSSSTPRSARVSRCGWKPARRPCATIKARSSVFWRLASTLPSANKLKRFCAAAPSNNNKLPVDLRAVLDAASELIQIQDLDMLYRRTVELAREKFEIERCGLYMVDESGDRFVRGTYGTDDQRRTTDERGSQRTTDEFADHSHRHPATAVDGARNTAHLRGRWCATCRWALGGWWRLSCVVR